MQDLRQGLLKLTCLLLIVTFSQIIGTSPLQADHPNIILIMADDMGYGDPQCYNAESQCVTPNIDRLAAQGMMFTDAHTAGSVCVPSRYGLLTGRYPFRAKLNWRSEAVIDQDRTTVPSFLKANGYQTAMVGKWHLGFEGGPDYDYANPLAGGPADRGFEDYFGMHASLDIPPYFYIRGDRAVMPPTETIGDSNTEGWSKIQGAFWRGGPVAPDFKHDEVLDRFADETVTRLKTLCEGDKPFFLYMALPAPHTPWLPAKRFHGIGGAGLYSEFVAHVDDVVGRVISTLDDTQASEDTLVIFTSDNGPVWYDEDEEKYGHKSCGPLRGMKGDSWEGGHRVPFIARWSKKIEAGSKCDHLIGFVDLISTCAEAIGDELPKGAGEDSMSFHSSLLNPAGAGSRTTMVHHHAATVLRDGNWKFINHLGSGGFSPPRKVNATPDGPQGQLYDLSKDIGESKNLWLQHPERVREMKKMLKQILNKSS